MYFAILVLLVQVKTAAVMLLTLKAAGGIDDLESVSEAGTGLVLYDQIWDTARTTFRQHSIVLSEKIAAAQQGSAASDPSMQHDLAATELYIKSAQQLLQELKFAPVHESESYAAISLKHYILTACYATASCQIAIPTARTTKPAAHTFISNCQIKIQSIMAVCSLVPRMVRAVESVYDSQALHLGVRVLIFENILEQQLCTGAANFIFLFALAMYRVAIDPDRSLMSSNIKAVEKMLKAVRFNHTEKLTVAR